MCVLKVKLIRRVRRRSVPSGARRGLRVNVVQEVLAGGLLVLFNLLAPLGDVRVLAGRLPAPAVGLLLLQARPLDDSLQEPPFLTLMEPSEVPIFVAALAV